MKLKCISKRLKLYSISIYVNVMANCTEKNVDKTDFIAFTANMLQTANGNKNVNTLKFVFVLSAFHDMP